MSHTNEASPSPLTSEQCEVLRVAESFIRENGYTQAPATRDRSSIDWELLDNPSHFEKILASRRDTLKAHAYGLRQGVPGDPLGWSVLFEPTERVQEVVKLAEGDRRRELSGTVVRVKLGLAKPIAVMQHTPIFLSAVKRLPPPAQVTTICAALGKSS